jgi:Sigma-54 interaction domain
MLSLRDVGATRPIATSLKQDDWRLLVTARANVLLEGPNQVTEAIVSEAMGWLPKPHFTWTEVPPRGHRPATLVVRSVSEFNLEQQRSLLGWLEASGDRVQVIATTTEPLYPLVGRGAFLANLYYRLNMLLLDVAAAA